MSINTPSMLNRKNIPNIITFIRGLLTIAIIILFLINYDKYISIIWTLFIAAAASDFFDGYLARKWNTISEFGKMADPLLDKMLVFSLLILVFEFDIVPRTFIMILVVRDLLIDSLRNYLARHNVSMPAIGTAKLKTTFQMLMINFILLTLIFPAAYALQLLTITTGMIAVVMSLWSATIYIKTAHTSLRQP